METPVENLAKLDKQIDVIKKRLNETVTERFAKINDSMQNGVELYGQAVLSAFHESDIFKTIIEEAVAKLRPRQAAMDAREVIGALRGWHVQDYYRESCIWCHVFWYGLTGIRHIKNGFSGILPKEMVHA